MQIYRNVLSYSLVSLDRFQENDLFSSHHLMATVHIAIVLCRKCQSITFILQKTQSAATDIIESEENWGVMSKTRKPGACRWLQREGRRSDSLYTVPFNK